MKTIGYVAIFAAALSAGGCAQKTALFNGHNLNGWVAHNDEGADNAAIWSVHNGILRASGQPFGYVRTEERYQNYTLFVQWRWTEKPTNSGVLLHINGQDRVWPLCIEAQLMHQRAGDFVTLQQGAQITVSGTVHQPTADRFYAIAARPDPDSEKPVGQWNQYKIICKDDTIALYVNGVLQNRAVNVQPSAGWIGLQSEGSPIEFRNIYLIPF